LILFGLGLTAWLYGQGIAALWRRAGLSRGVTVGQAGAFFAGLLVLFVALVSPLDALSGALFSAHMAQHLLLVVVAAPLLVWGAPPLTLLWAVPHRGRRPLAGWWHRQAGLRGGWRLLTQPVTVWLLHTLALWLWHAPAFYQAALTSESVHLLEHASFLGTALLFWWVILQPGDKGLWHYGVGMILAFATAMQSGLLGALMTFATMPWYPAYRATTTAWGLTPLDDQQLAGVIMWVPAGVVYLGATLMLLGVWLHRMERNERETYDQIRILGGFSKGTATKEST
jgi:putative membrane protein